MTPGKEYKFRVSAVNAEGEGEPLVADQTILAKNPFGKLAIRIAKHRCRIVKRLEVQSRFVPLELSSFICDFQTSLVHLETSRPPTGTRTTST